METWFGPAVGPELPLEPQVRQQGLPFPAVDQPQRARVEASSSALTGVSTLIQQHQE